MCNVTISSKEILAKSGQTFGEIKSSAGLGGPAFCWYRFEAEPNQRVELQVYRIKRLGKRHLESNRCVGGFLQLVKGTSLEYRYVFLMPLNSLAFIENAANRFLDKTLAPGAILVVSSSFVGDE